MKIRTLPAGFARSNWGLAVLACACLTGFVLVNAGTFSTDSNSGDPAGATVTDQGTFKTANNPVDLPAGTLFIEAEDFNYGHGQWIKNKPIGMTGPYPGGDYRDLGDGVDGTVGDGSDLGIDYFEVNPSNDPGAVPAYRGGTGVEVAKENGPAGISRGSFDVTVNHTVGWNDTGDWYNYTRAFPTNNQLYKVYARTATDVGQTRNTQLSLVTSDPTKTNQTVQVLGIFNAPSTGGWDTWPATGTPADALVPLRDAASADVLVKLSGVVTLRYTFLPGASDVDYLAFVPSGSGGMPPKVASVKPANNASGQSDLPVIEANIEDGEVAIVVSASLKLDGTAVSAAVQKNGKTTKVSFTPTTPLAAGSAHNVSLVYTDSAAPPVTTTKDWSFSVSFTPFRADTLFIEAEDFNFGHGQWIKDKPIGMTGPYPGGDYTGKGDGGDGADCDGSDFGKDYHETNASNDGGAVPAYRPGTGVEIAKPNGPAGLNRGTFEVQVNNTVGWNDEGDWYNYTRKFPEPAQSYKVYARTATDVGQTRNTQLSKITSDPTQCNQTEEVLGTFNGPSTGGWDTWPDAGTTADALLPLRDAEGKDVLLTLGGEVTLRYTFLPGASDVDYFAFLPSAQPAPGAKLFAAVNDTSTTVYVVFTGALNPIIATNPTNYTLGGGVTVLSASLLGVSVILTTTTLTNGNIYTVAINNLLDAGGNPIPSVTNSFVAQLPKIDSIRLEGPDVVITWSDNAQLLQAQSVKGPWQPVTGVTNSTYRVRTANAAQLQNVRRKHDISSGSLFGLSAGNAYTRIAYFVEDTPTGQLLHPAPGFQTRWFYVFFGSTGTWGLNTPGIHSAVLVSGFDFNDVQFMPPFNVIHASPTVYLICVSSSSTPPDTLSWTGPPG